jgi:hypothetical protein
MRTIFGESAERASRHANRSKGVFSSWSYRATLSPNESPHFGTRLRTMDASNAS